MRACVCVCVWARPGFKEGEFHWISDGAKVSSPNFHKDNYGGFDEECMMMGWTNTKDTTFHDAPCDDRDVFDKTQCTFPFTYKGKRYTDCTPVSLPGVHAC